MRRLPFPFLTLVQLSPKTLQPRLFQPTMRTQHGQVQTMQFVHRGLHEDATIGRAVPSRAGGWWPSEQDTFHNSGWPEMCASTGRRSTAYGTGAMLLELDRTVRPRSWDSPWQQLEVSPFHPDGVSTQD